MAKIIADTTSCLPEDVQDQYNIPVVPQMIHFGEDSFTEGTDINTETFLAKLEQRPEFPKTSAPPPELFAKLFYEYQVLNKPVLCIHPSSDLSGTVRSAETARLDFPQMDIHVIDTKLVASPLGVVVEQAAKMAAEDIPIEEILKATNDLSSRGRIFFLVATLDNLARGGRIGGASALVGNALQLKPILTLVNGKVDPHSKERTFSKALLKIKQLVLEAYPSRNDGHLTIMHAGGIDQANELAEFFSSELHISHPPISFLPPAIIAHAGPGSLAIGFFE